MKEDKASKNTIHLFLASSITDLKEDRRDIGDFINTLNTIYNKQNIFIHLHKCESESEDHTAIKGGTQKCLNDEICESDLCIVLFWHKAGDITEEEMRLAWKEFDIKNNPKIIVFFKSLAEGEVLPDDVRRVMEDVDERLLHYHREYAHIDSLKLEIITQLQVHGFLRVNMNIEDNQVTLAGHNVALTENIPVYSRNDEYKELVEKCRSAEEKCAKLKKIHEQNRDSTRAQRDFQKAIIEKERAQEDLKRVSDEILNIGTRIAKVISTSTPTERICKAIQCFDRGDFNGVLDILPPDEIDKGFYEADVLEENAKMKRLSSIEEYRIRISALEAQGKWKEVQEDYERVVEKVEDSLNSPKTIILEYAKFLYKQKNYRKSLDVCTRLQTALVQYANALSKEDIAELYDLQGELFFCVHEFKDAESFLLKAIELRKTSTMQGQEQDIQIAELYVKLAKVYYKVTHYFEAEALYTQALDYYRKYDTNAVETIDADIARTCIELGDLYYMINRHEDAHKLFVEAYHKYTELFNSGKKHCKSALAEACNKIVYLNVAVYSHCKDERYYTQAMKIKQLLTQQDPVAYMLFLERIIKKLGQYWKENGNINYGNIFLLEAERIASVIQNKQYADNKEEYRALNYDFYDLPINKPFIEQVLQESLQYYKGLADENPDAYDPSLAKTYNVAGMFYTQIGEKLKAEMNYKEAIDIKERLVSREKAIKPDIAASYSSLSQHYTAFSQYEKAEKYALQAIDIYTTVSKETGAFDTDLARTHFTFANLYVKAGKYKEAEENYMKSILLYIKLYEKSSRAYVDRIINTVNNVVTLIDPIESSKWMEEFVDEDKVAEWLKTAKGNQNNI